jgi:hypothetical protein
MKKPLEATMRLTNRRQQNRHSTQGPRIAISQDEITADLLYRGGKPRRAIAAPSARSRR